MCIELSYEENCVNSFTIIEILENKLMRNNTLQSPEIDDLLSESFEKYLEIRNIENNTLISQ